MRLIQNTSLQGYSIPFTTPSGPFEVFVRPKRTIKVPDNHTSKILENLITRRILKVIKRQEPLEIETKINRKKR